MKAVRVWVVSVVPHPWLKRWPHAEKLNNDRFHRRRYVLSGSDLLKKDLEADEDVDSITAWWALDHEFSECDEWTESIQDALDEIILQPDAWSFDGHRVGSPLWTTKERAEQALKEIERELTK